MRGVTSLSSGEDPEENLITLCASCNEEIHSPQVGPLRSKW
ncbi:MAG: HNH endonuclease [Candidatus Sulfotelmatobacter sp.]